MYVGVRTLESWSTTPCTGITITLLLHTVHVFVASGYLQYEEILQWKKKVLKPDMLSVWRALIEFAALVDFFSLFVDWRFWRRIWWSEWSEQHTTAARHVLLRVRSSDTYTQVFPHVGILVHRGRTANIIVHPHCSYRGLRLPSTFDPVAHYYESRKS